MSNEIMSTATTATLPAIRTTAHSLRRFAIWFASAAVAVVIGASWLDAMPATAAPVAAAGAPAASASLNGDRDDMPTPTPRHSGAAKLSGKLNLNTANEEQLMLLPGVGQSKADRIVAFRKKSGGFKRVADLRRVKGFGYKSLKKLEPFLDIKGETSLAKH